MTINLEESPYISHAAHDLSDCSFSGDPLAGDDYDYACWTMGYEPEAGAVMRRVEVGNPDPAMADMIANQAETPMEFWGSVLPGDNKCFVFYKYL
jgi:hypothetical protein